jgi:hypothetical protein
MNFRLLVVCALLGSASLLVRAEDETTWTHRAAQGAVMLTANPLGSESRTAFYGARGFPEATIRPYAQACGFSFGMQNGSANKLTTRLADWHAVSADDKHVALRLPEAWDMEWVKSGVSEAARIAFRWAQFQSENTFEPGDWIMGMATLEVPLSGTFRLVARYRDDKGNHEIVLDKLSCAKN